MGNDALGSNPYKRAMQAARANNLAGPQYHLHDKHFKKWCEGKSPEEIAEAIGSKKQKSTQKTSSTKVLSKKEAKAAVQKAKAITASVAPVPITKTKEVKKKEREEQLKEKYREMQREKFVNSFKSHCRCDDVKSVGNGL